MVDALFSTDNYLMAKKLLDVTALRHEALASNIANVETPGYKRVDISKDFDAQLKTAVEKKDKIAIRELAPSIVEDPTAAAVRPDGNNVSLDSELMESNKNAVQYDFLTQYASTNLKMMLTAMKTSNN